VVLHFQINQDRSIVTIKVYDYIGREAADLFLDVLNKGEYSQKIKLGNIPKGYYYIVIEINDLVVGIQIIISR
jgi:hypothetical protein